MASSYTEETLRTITLLGATTSLHLCVDLWEACNSMTYCHNVMVAGPASVVGLAAIDTALMFGNLAAAAVQIAQMKHGLDIRGKVTETGQSLLTLVNQIQAATVLSLETMTATPIVPATSTAVYLKIIRYVISL